MNKDLTLYHGRIKIVVAFGIVLVLLALTSCITTTVPAEEVDELQRIEELPGITKNEIYDQALNWFARSYNSANNVIQLRDPDGGRIIGRGRGYVDFGLGTGGYYTYTIIVDIKEERMRIRYENITSEDFNMNPWWDKVSENLKDHSLSLISFINKSEEEESW